MKPKASPRVTSWMLASKRLEYMCQVAISLENSQRYNVRGSGPPAWSRQERAPPYGGAPVEATVSGYVVRGSSAGVASRISLSMSVMPVLART